MNLAFLLLLCILVSVLVDGSDAFLEFADGGVQDDEEVVFDSACFEGLFGENFDLALLDFDGSLEPFDVVDVVGVVGVARGPWVLVQITHLVHPWVGCLCRS